jgi:hypothetical protein
VAGFDEVARERLVHVLEDALVALLEYVAPTRLQQPAKANSRQLLFSPILLSCLAQIDYCFHFRLVNLFELKKNSRCFALWKGGKAPFTYILLIVKKIRQPFNVQALLQILVSVVSHSSQTQRIPILRQVGERFEEAKEFCNTLHFFPSLLPAPPSPLPNTDQSR